MKLKFMSLILVAAASMQSMAAFASDAGLGVSTSTTSSKVSALKNPSKDKIVGSDTTTLERRVESGPMARTTQVNRVTHGGDSSIPIDRMPGGNPLGGSGISTGAKIPGPNGDINHKSVVPATKEEVGGGAVGAPAN